MRKRALIVAALLSAIAVIRTDFSPDAVAAPLASEREGSFEIVRYLRGAYRYLGQGRQSYVFVSEDGQTVIKFFKKRYFSIPWYAFFRTGEAAKRDQRRAFFLQSYRIAEAHLKEETGVIAVHLGKSDYPIGTVTLVDRASRRFTLNLDEIPFVLQKRGVPFYPSLSEENLPASIETFLSIIAKRISLGIADADHDVENNFGFLEGKPFHWDPGRFSYCPDLIKEDRLEHEWWSATHRFRDWIESNYPPFTPIFDGKKNERKTKQMRSLKPLSESLAPQRDGKLPE